MTASAQLRSGKGSRDENFPVASWLIKRRHRPAILAFYEFVRVADDIADHPSLAAAEKLARLDRLERSLLGEGNDEPEGVALAAVLQERGLSPRHAQDLLNAFRLDVTKLRYANWDELIAYCSLSAMPVGRFVLDVHGESRATWPASDALCAALQIINHLQDCGEDYREPRPRLYSARCARRQRASRRWARARQARPCATACVRWPRAPRRCCSRAQGFDRKRRRHRAWRSKSPPSRRWPSACSYTLASTRSLERARASRQVRRRLPRPRAAPRAACCADCCAVRRALAATRRHEYPVPSSCRRALRRRRRAPAAARSTSPCASSAASSARRCSRSIRSAAPSMTSPTARRRANGDWRSSPSGGGRSMRFMRVHSARARTLARAIGRFGLRKEDFLAVIDGMEMDAQADIRAPSLEQLDLYCDRVASAVGRLSVRVFGMDEADGQLLAHHLGRALQLTNILRDLDEDAGVGRLYLPQEALRAAGIDDHRSDDRPCRSAARCRLSFCRRARARAFRRGRRDHVALPAPRGAGAADHGRGLQPDARRHDGARAGRRRAAAFMSINRI